MLLVTSKLVREVLAPNWSMLLLCATQQMAPSRQHSIREEVTGTGSFWPDAAPGEEVHETVAGRSIHTLQIAQSSARFIPSPPACLVFLLRQSVDVRES